MNILLVALIGATIIVVAAVSYSLGRSARKREGSNSLNTDDTVIRLKALSPASQEVVIATYKRRLELDDIRDPKFKRVQCD